MKFYLKLVLLLIMSVSAISDTHASEHLPEEHCEFQVPNSPKDSIDKQILKISEDPKPFNQILSASDQLKKDAKDIQEIHDMFCQEYIKIYQTYVWADPLKLEKSSPEWRDGVLAKAIERADIQMNFLLQLQQCKNK